jgi:hypothetical protein
MNIPPDVWIVAAGFVGLWLFGCVSKWLAYDEQEIR